MGKKAQEISNFYQNITDWIKETKDHEITQMVDLVEQAKAYLIAAESIPQEKIKQFIDSFVYDLNEFYQHNQAQVQSSLYLALMNESLWQSLASMTDKSQVEWSELMDDFKHDGIYHVGDYIGFGELACQRCQHKVEINHLSQVTACIECGGEQFIRHALKP